MQRFASNFAPIGCMHHDRTLHGKPWGPSGPPAGASATYSTIRAPAPLRGVRKQPFAATRRCELNPYIIYNVADGFLVSSFKHRALPKPETRKPETHSPLYSKKFTFSFVTRCASRRYRL